MPTPAAQSYSTRHRQRVPARRITAMQPSPACWTRSPACAAIVPRDQRIVLVLQQVEAIHAERNTSDAVEPTRSVNNNGHLPIPATAAA
jgi:hypothetical protein